MLKDRVAVRTDHMLSQKIVMAVRLNKQLHDEPVILKLGTG